ncbi:MAG: CCA tRNA nucleotidyltransferase, partial [Halobacteriaceae archaeon]
IDQVRPRVDPTPEEREKLRQVASEIIERTRAATSSRVPEADVMQVGSTARGTWVRGDRDIDIFIRFPPDMPRDELERLGIEIGHEVLPSGHEEYAEHPYVKGTYMEYDVDLVPCYRVKEASDIQSAVDRTPFHTTYIRERLNDDLAADVRLAKQFFKGIRVYGSDLATRGFSGYLVELLTCEYGGFVNMIEQIADWNPPVTLDPADHGQASFDDPLTVIDPTDPERNVAAVVVPEQVASAQHHSRVLLKQPATDHFFHDGGSSVSKEDVIEHLNKRDTHPIAIQFDAPDLVPDQLWPQLDRSLKGLQEGLSRAGFEPLRGEAFSEETAVLLVECEVSQRPRIERHEGPPVHVKGHANSFYENYADDSDVYGPFIEGNRYVVERPRTFQTPVEYVEESLLDVALGVDVRRELERGYEIFVNDEIAELTSSFDKELGRYFNPKP